MTTTTLIALAPETALALAAVAGLLVGGWLPRRRQWAVRALALAAVAAGLVATGFAAAGPAHTAASGSYAVDIGLHAARAAVLAGTGLVVLAGTDGLAGDRRESEAYVLLLLAAAGALVMAGANGLLLLVMGYLLASVPLYALVAFGKDARGTEAGLKYFLLGALFSVALLGGTTVLLAVGGATGYPALAVGLPGAHPAAAAAGAVAVLAALLFKAGAVPAHFWVPDAAEGAPAPVAAFITTVPKIGALVAACRLGAALPQEAMGNWSLLVAAVSAAAMVLGNLAAFAQDGVRRLLAYSAVGQVGFLLMAVAASARAQETALPGLLYYLAAYTLTNVGAFAAVCALPRAERLDQWRGLFGRRPWLALSLVVCLLGLVGTPPTAVFVGKLTVFTAAFDAGLVWLVVLAAATTAASLFYYLRWILPLFQTSREGGADSAASGPAGRWSSAVAIAAAALSLLLGVAAGPVLDWLGSGVPGISPSIL
ncbi:NADH-quinone oxidoreductase subunit N [Streptomonospora wellingtoniae]|uniref:NADH-quinone oxidoreductase subunit N n=1 Tax=Streptomonospora wellingtoniae TaxID=3075544 RepID=A0ABU2KWS0_9ACTN|nr:proton-conducting transporter membrane subunit [Streptomonospora sp. DSM 45055]MDT0303702.1 proton-conducting transporter membrane subunit [Streptomonospora sp. DSM 45055]